MTKREKLIIKLLSFSKSFTYDELRTLMTGFGYTELVQGKTSGSRVAFYNKNNNHLIRLHKPHPGNELKHYQIDYIINELKNIGILE